METTAELKRLMDLCAELEDALIRNHAERLHLERLKERADEMMREFRKVNRLDR